MGLTFTRSEAEIQRAILTYLATRADLVVWRSNSRVMRVPGKGGASRLLRFGFKGQPDLMGYRIQDGVARFVAIEVKRPGGKLSPEQSSFLGRVHADGGIAILATSVEDVHRALGSTLGAGVSSQGRQGGGVGVGSGSPTSR